MAIIINDNYTLNLGKPIDSKYLNGQLPWTSISEVNSAIPLAYRYSGLTVNINNVEYWYYNGLTNNNLVIKLSTNALSGTTNGLTKNGQIISLGGTLTGNTIFINSSNQSLKYSNDSSNSYTARSIVDAGYVTGKTSNILSTFNTFTGTTLPANYYNKIQINSYTGETQNAISCKADKSLASQGQIIYRNATELTGCNNLYYCDSNKSLSFGRNNTANGNDSAIFGGYNNTVSAVCSSIIGGHDNIIASNSLRSSIIGGQNIVLSGSGYNDTVAINCLAIMCTPTGTGNVLCWNNTTKKIGLTYGGLITGATNGLHTNNQEILFGGLLTECTNIYGACLNIDALSGFNVRTSGNTDINIDAQQCGGFLIKSQCGNIDSFPDFTNAVGILGNILAANGFAIYDNRTGSTRTGIVYDADYSKHYVPRSLVDKAYVDTVATGLNIHEAVIAATTTNIILSGITVVDGITTNTGMRILVKNQLNGALNGIYSASTGNWSRTNDYINFGTQITNGDLIPVTSGNTLNNSIWALTTPDPIISGDTLLYTEFATIIDVVGGNGINVIQTGGVHNISVQLASNCGLNFCGTGLAVNSNIAGIGLCYNNGVINTKTISCGNVSAIPVGYNSGNCLIVACSDITNAANAITNANNGLTRSGNNVILGGTLTGNTTINGNSTICLNITCLTDFNLGFCNSIITDTNGIPKGLQYNADYSNTYVKRSLVDMSYVTGKTNAIISTINAYTGTTAPNKYETISNFNLYTGTTAPNKYETISNFNLYTGITAPNTYYNKTQINSYTGATSTLISKSITGVTNGLTRNGQTISLGGALTGNTVFINSSNQSLKYNNDSSSSYTARSIADAGYVTGKTSGATLTSISITINGSGGVIASGHYGGYMRIPYNGNITGWAIYEGSDVPISSTATMDVWISSTFYPTVANTIFDTKPSLSSTTNNSASGLSIAVSIGNIITFNVDSNVGAKILTLSLNITKH